MHTHCIDTQALKVLYSIWSNIDNMPLRALPSMVRYLMHVQLPIKIFCALCALSSTPCQDHFYGCLCGLLVMYYNDLEAWSYMSNSQRMGWVSGHKWNFNQYFTTKHQSLSCIKHRLGTGTTVLDGCFMNSRGDKNSEDTSIFRSIVCGWMNKPTF